MVDLFEKRLNGEYRVDGLGFADYDSLKKKTKLMSKEDLEDFYIDKKNHKKVSFFVVFSVLVLIGFVIFASGMIFTAISIEKTQNIVYEESKDICKYLPEDYVSSNLIGGFMSNDHEVKIDCRV